MRVAMIAVSLLSVCCRLLVSPCVAEARAALNGIYDGNLDRAEGSYDWCPAQIRRAVTIDNGAFSTTFPVSARSGETSQLTISGTVTADGHYRVSVMRRSGCAEASTTAWPATSVANP
jgi:hypothetical protein